VWHNGSPSCGTYSEIEAAAPGGPGALPNVELAQPELVLQQALEELAAAAQQQQQQQQQGDYRATAEPEAAAVEAAAQAAGQQEQQEPLQSLGHTPLAGALAHGSRLCQRGSVIGAQSMSQVRASQLVHASPSSTLGR
jgi:hypothetical protein